MKWTVYLVVLACAMLFAGCSAAPVVMRTDSQRKVITRCDNDMFCFRKAYDIAWDNACHTGCHYCVTDSGVCNGCGAGAFPVSYRSREIVYRNDPYGYDVTLPAGGTVAVPASEKTKEGPHE